MNILINQIKKKGNIIFLIFILFYLIYFNKYEVVLRIEIATFIIILILSIIVLVINSIITKLFLNLYIKKNSILAIKITAINSLSNFVIIGSGILFNTYFLKSKYNISFNNFLSFTINRTLLGFIVFFFFGSLFALKYNYFISIVFFFLFLIITIFYKFSNYFVSLFNKFKYINNYYINYINFSDKLKIFSKKIFILYLLNYLISSLIFYYIFQDLGNPISYLLCCVFVSLIILSRLFLITFMDFGLGELFLMLLYINNLEFMDILFLSIIIQKFIYFLASLLIFCITFLTNEN